MPDKKILLTIISLFLIAAAALAPAPYNIALNYETKQCAGYWAGDEYESFTLPRGWKAFEFQYFDDFIIAETDIGTCKVYKSATSQFEKPCCLQLGYSYITRNIGVRIYHPGEIAAIIMPFILIILAIIAIVVWRKKSYKSSRTV